MTYEKQLKSELKAIFNPDDGEASKTIDTCTLDKFWHLFQTRHPHLKNIQRAAWEKVMLKFLGVMGIFKD